MTVSRPAEAAEGYAAHLTGIARPTQPPVPRQCLLKVNLQLRTPSRLPAPAAASNLAATRNEIGLIGGANLILWSESAEIPSATSVAVPSGLICPSSVSE